MFGYGIGSMGQGASYKFVGSYFITYLVGCVYLDPKTASLIASVALYVEAIAGILVGSLSDTCTSKMGRRRPFILASTIVVPIVLVCMTHTIHAGGSVKVIYYMFFAILFRVFFSVFDIPFGAFGTEIVQDYDGRTKLRTISRLCGIAGNVVGYVIPVFLLGFFEGNEETGWQIIGIIVSVTVFVAFASAFIFTKGKGIVLSKENKVKKGNILVDILKNYVGLLKLKPMKYMVVYKGCVMSALSLYDVGMIWYLTLSLKQNNTNSALIYAVQIVVFLIATPVVRKLALMLGKAKAQLTTLFTCAAVGTFVFIVNPKNMYFGIVYLCVFSMMQTSFWQISYSMFDDCNEVDEWVNGRRREGNLSSMMSVLGTIVAAVMVQLFGIFLSASGYDAMLAEQAASTVNFINAEYILMPSILCLIAGIAVILQPINKKRFDSLRAALKARKEGEDYSQYMDDVNKLI
ncbi:MAG: MFS transporter [Clostridia bacterium]|nr:MFS transporter [Clostridia bacterium]